MAELLEIDDTILDFRSRRILSGIYLKSEKGKITGLLGSNGCGKSCLFKIIFGTLTPQQKSIRIDSKHIKKINSKTIKYLPQFEFIPKSLRLKQIFNNFNLDFSRFTRNFPDFKIYYNDKMDKLSGGERRIVEIYSILTSECDFCLLDEPFSQVMPLHINSIKELINQEKQNKGIIISDHLYENILDISDDLHMLYKARTYQINSVEDLDKYNYIRIKK